MYDLFFLQFLVYGVVVELCSAVYTGWYLEKLLEKNKKFLAFAILAVVIGIEVYVAILFDYGDAKVAIVYVVFAAIVNFMAYFAPKIFV